MRRREYVLPGELFALKRAKLQLQNDRYNYIGHRGGHGLRRQLTRVRGETVPRRKSIASVEVRSWGQSPPGCDSVIVLSVLHGGQSRPLSPSARSTPHSLARGGNRTGESRCDTRYTKNRRRDDRSAICRWTLGASGRSWRAFVADQVKDISVNAIAFRSTQPGGLESTRGRKEF